MSLSQVSIGLDNGLSPIQRQAIIQTNAGLLSIEPLGTKFSEILIKIQTFSFTKMHLKIASVKWQPFCPGGDETNVGYRTHFELKKDNPYLIFFRKKITVLKFQLHFSCLSCSP